MTGKGLFSTNVSMGAGKKMRFECIKGRFAGHAILLQICFQFNLLPSGEMGQRVGQAEVMECIGIYGRTLVHIT